MEAPAITLDKSIEVAEHAREKIISKKPFRIAEEYWNTLGPGLITGASDDDPAGIATYSQAGAGFGTHFLWMSVYVFPLMATIQEMCARIGMVTGRGLAANIRNRYSPIVLYVVTMLLFIANTFNIGADLGMMAKSAQLLFPQASFGWLLVGFVVITLTLQIFTTYARYARYLKYLAFVLIAYIITGIILPIDWSTIFSTVLIPTIPNSKETLFIVCAILGTTISPYLFFWQTAQEVEEEILAGKKTIRSRRGATTQEIQRMRSDVWSGMFFSNLVMFFIIAVCSTVLAGQGVVQINSAADAAMALRPLVGDAAYLLFTIGIIGTGLLAIPVLAGSAAYALSECFRWHEGLYRTLRQAHAFYGVIMLSVGIGFLINFIGLNSIHALLYSAVLNALVAPLILFLIVHLSSDKKIMGEWVNTRLSRSVGWAVVGLMTTVGVATIAVFAW